LVFQVYSDLNSSSGRDLMLKVNIGMNPSGNIKEAEMLALKKERRWGTWLSQLECATLDLRVESSSPTLGVEIT